MPGPRLIVQGISKRFRQYSARRARTLKQQLLWGRSTPPETFWALRNVSTEVSPGEMLGVVGRNGSGKSTLLRILGGVMRPDEGDVQRNGRLRGLLELNTGMHLDLSGRENILINGVIAGLTETEVRRNMDEIIAFSDLGQFINQPVRTYSAGMKLRLGFSVSVHTEPDIFLIDEVLSVGDLGFQQKCLNRIRVMKEAGCSIVVISHDLGQVEELCDRALWLQHGHCRAYGQPDEIVSQYRAEMHAETRRRAPTEVRVHHTTAGIALRHDDNRFGSLEAVIENVRVIGATGEPTSVLRTGDDVVFEIDILANVPLQSPHVGLAFGRYDEVDCLDMNSAMDHVVFGEICGRRTVAIRFKRLDLGAGRYFISVGVHEHEWSHTFDYHRRAYIFDVESDTIAPGLLVPPREWRLI